MIKNLWIGACLLLGVNFKFHCFVRLLGQIWRTPVFVVNSDEKSSKAQAVVRSFPNNWSAKQLHNRLTRMPLPDHICVYVSVPAAWRCDWWNLDLIGEAFDYLTLDNWLKIMHASNLDAVVTETLVRLTVRVTIFLVHRCNCQFTPILWIFHLIPERSRCIRH